MTELNSQQNKIRIKMLKRLISTSIKNGFKTLKMEDVAKFMDVSRATMYKYFSSKEEVMDGVVNVYIDYINGLVLQTLNGTDSSYAIRFQQLFEQSIHLTESITSAFLNDLETIFPDLYYCLTGALHNREQQIIKFYESGISADIFNKINPKLILLQDEVMLSEIVSYKYLLRNHVTLKQILYDYYFLKKIQLFKAEKLKNIDDSMIDSIIDHCVEKFKRRYE